MGKFGDKLRRERELRGVTLDEIADATKIGTRSLKALEDERFDLLPGGIFNKGFVRSYARFLGLDEEQAVADYQTALSEQPNRADVIEKMAAQAEASRKNEAAALGEKGGKSNALWIAGAILVLIAAGASGGWRYYQRYFQQKSAASTVQAEPTVVVPPTIKTTPAAPDVTAVAEQSAVTSAPTDATSTSATPAQAMNTEMKKPETTKSVDSYPTDSTTKPVIELQIHVSRATWLSVQTDGKAPITETLRDSATKTVIAQERVVLTTGNAIEVTCNGRSLGLLGKDNERSQMRFTSDCKVN